MLKIIFIFLLAVCFFSCDNDEKEMVTPDILYYKAFYMNDFPVRYNSPGNYFRDGYELFSYNDSVIKAYCKTTITVVGEDNITHGYSSIAFNNYGIDSISLNFYRFSNTHSFYHFLSIFSHRLEQYVRFNVDNFGYVSYLNKYKINLPTSWREMDLKDNCTIDFQYPITLDSLSQILPVNMVYTYKKGLTSIEFQKGMKLEWVRHAD